MPSDEATNPIDQFLRSSKQLFTPENLVADAAMDIVRNEVRQHLERKIREDPALARELKDAVKELLEARAMEYSAIIRVSAAIARLGIGSVPEAMKDKLAKELASFVSRELSAVVDKTL